MAQQKGYLQRKNTNETKTETMKPRNPSIKNCRQPQLR